MTACHPSLSRLGPTFFFEDPVSPAVVQHIHKLGPCYIGSFQSPTLNQSVRHLHMRHPSLLSPSFPLPFRFLLFLFPLSFSPSFFLFLAVFFYLFFSSFLEVWRWSVTVDTHVYTCMYEHSSNHIFLNKKSKCYPKSPTVVASTSPHCMHAHVCSWLACNVRVTTNHLYH